MHELPKSAGHCDRRRGVRFPVGRIYFTRGALDNPSVADAALTALDRHAAGDWGEVCEDDRLSNEQALTDGGRLLSAYRAASGERFWIITERDRSATTVLLPDEY